MSQSNMPGGGGGGAGFPDRRSFGGGAGGSGGGNPTTSDYLMAQETNRQILLILVRLREDTNNVLTRLSFLESSVVSLQVSARFWSISPRFFFSISFLTSQRNQNRQTCK